jgi:hypothetical protein
MGHYYSEMCCDTCGSIRCKCPPPPKPVYNDAHFLISDGKVITVKEFKETYGWTTINGMKFRTLSWETGIYNKILYETKKAAEKELLKQVKHQIKTTQSVLRQLEKKRDRLQASTNK